MQTLVHEFNLSPEQARAAFGAVRAVVATQSPIGEAGARLLEVAAAAFEQPDDWRQAFPRAQSRRVLVDALLIPACIEGEVTAAGQAAIEQLAKPLGVRSHWVRLLTALRRRRVLAIKRQLIPRSPDANRLFKRIWAEEGLLGVWRALLFVAGRYTDPPLAARFRELGALAKGSLGRALFDDFAAKGLAFPGEPGGLPERMIHHDLMHVINGDSTEPAGECELAGFYAGFCPGDAFTFIVTVLTTFQLGLPVSPAVVRPARGAFDPGAVLQGFIRGRRLKVDVMGAWDYWALMGLDLDRVRAELGIGRALPEQPAEQAL